MKLNIGYVESAYDEVLKCYELEELQEIVNHGCQSGVCSQHIYYADTIKFFDTYEEEIVDYLDTNYGQDGLVELFKSANCSLDMYKNNVTWAYIELIASQVVDTDNEMLSEFDGLNDAKSMNDRRYAML